MVTDPLPAYFCRIVNILLSRGNLNGNRSITCIFLLDREYSVIKSDIVKRFDSIYMFCVLKRTVSVLKKSLIETVLLNTHNKYFVET